MAKCISEVRRYISSVPDGAIFSTKQCLIFTSGNRKTVDRSLARLVAQGVLDRLANGVFVVANRRKEYYSNLEIAVIKASTTRKILVTNSMLGHEETVHPIGSEGARFITNNGNTKFHGNGELISLDQTSARKFQLSGSGVGRLILNLWHKGHQKVTSLDICEATATLNRSELRELVELAHLMPIWLSTKTKEAIGPKWLKIEKELKYQTNQQLKRQSTEPVKRQITTTDSSNYRTENQIY